MIKGGEYLGYGFIEKTETINHIEDFHAYLIPQKNNIDIPTGICKNSIEIIISNLKVLFCLRSLI